MENTEPSSAVTSPQAGISRRGLLKAGVVGISVLAAESLAPRWLRSAAASIIEPTRGRLRLTASECLVEMVDETQVYMWCYADDQAPHFPGPVIVAKEGSRIELSLANKLPVNTSFVIPGVVDSGTLRPRQSKVIKFVMPESGTYLYYDTTKDPIHRVMGLHGALISMPHHGNTPYSHPTQQVQELFDDLGTHVVFPGYPWDPQNTVVWVFSQVDPKLNNRVRNGQVKNPAQFARAFEPRYFTINGRSGYFSAHAHDTHLHSTVGYPHLIRNINAGLWGHSPHTHANHSYVLSVNGQVQDNVVLLDTWTMRPLERKDVLFPFVRPPDIPDEVWDRVEEGIQEEPFPMLYPMHCHQEVSNTAAGGNYPQGNVTHIDILGPIDTIGSQGDPPDGLPGSGHSGEH